MKILGFFAALMLAVAAHGQGTANPGVGGGMNFITPSPTLSPSSISNSFVLINNGAATNLNVNVLTNQGGFFMGGSGTFGTNNSGSTLTVNMATTMNGTFSLDTYRVYLHGSGNQVASSNIWAMNPYNVGLGGAAGFMPIPSKYRYIKRAVFILSGLELYSETNWPSPTLKMCKPDQYNILDNGSALFAETEHGGSTFAERVSSWTNFPAVWKTSNFVSQGSRKGLIFYTTNSVAMPVVWWSNATASASDAFWFQRFGLFNANTISMSNGVPPEGYVEFSTMP